MTRTTLAVLVGLTFAACSEQVPVAPLESPDLSQLQAARPQPLPGTYTMWFDPTITGLGVILVAIVTDGAGNPAQAGTASFYSCSFGGHAAPRAECDTGSGHWAFEGRAEIIAFGPMAGRARLGYTSAPAPGTVIGFRFKYSARRSVIANGVSASADHTF